MQPPVIDAFFEYAVQRYFEVVLPCFLTAHYRGGGYGLVAEMLAAHDGGVEAIHAACEGVVPSKKSVKLAARVRAQCPPALVSGGLERGLLGLFSKQATAISGEMLHSYREIDARWQVLVFADSFMVNVPEDRQGAEVLLTLFHEYIHYFESFLLRSEQPLRSREEGHYGLAERALSLREAHARDRKILRRRRIGRGLVIGIALAIAVAAILSRIDLETEADRAIWRRQIATLDTQIAALEALAARKDAVEAAARVALADRLDFALDRLTAHARTRCPGARIDALGGVDLLTVRIADGPACLRALEETAPAAPLFGARRDRLGWQLSFRVGGQPASLPPVEAWDPKAPDFGTAEGERLREGVRERLDRTRALRPVAQQVAKREAEIRMAERPPPPVAELLAALPGDLQRVMRTRDEKLEAVVDATGAEWVRARLPEGERAHIVGGWIPIALTERQTLSGRPEIVAHFAPLAALAAPP